MAKKRLFHVYDTDRNRDFIVMVRSMEDAEDVVIGTQEFSDSDEFDFYVVEIGEDAIEITINVGRRVFAGRWDWIFNIIWRINESKNL